VNGDSLALEGREEELMAFKDAPTRAGDVLGISDAAPDPEIAKSVRRGSGRPKGIDVREPAMGIDDVPQGSGATGIDMGGAGEGTDIDFESSRPHSAEDRDE
jgi:hypothetical protein